MVEDQIAAKTPADSSSGSDYPGKHDPAVHHMNAAFFNYGKRYLLPHEGDMTWDKDIMGDSAWICVRDYLADIYNALPNGKKEWLDKVYHRKSKKTGADLSADVIASVKKVIEDDSV